ncbi:MAG TPA: hypothetical protein VGL25_05965 [Casimicrobiaceae bacterium]|jgi:hypothetical protein
MRLLRGNLRRSVASAVAFLALLLDLSSSAADLHKAVPTPIKAPDCIGDPAQSFFADDVLPTEAPQAVPNGRYYLVVRYLGKDAVASPADYDFGHFSVSYPARELRGFPVTGLTVPAPASTWQRARLADATVDDSSAFQIYCDHAGSFINSWTFPNRPVTGGGPHAIYAYNFDSRSWPSIFDDKPATDFALQANIEIPWFRTWIDPQSRPTLPPIGQVSLFAYFHDRLTDKPFAFLLAVFDNRFGEVLRYQTYVSHDGELPFVSLPLNRHAPYATPYPKSAQFTGTTWSGLRLFGARITQAQFRAALKDLNAYCAARVDLPNCASAPGIGAAYNTNITDYALTSFGVLHEIFGTDAHNHLSMGVHVSGLGAWNFR